MTDTPVLSIRDLVVEFPTDDGIVHAVGGVSYDVYPGEALGVVGESGSGKSQTFLAAMGLLESNARANGRVVLQGQELLGLNQTVMNRFRGTALAMIFQDPLSSLTPNLRIGSQLSEVLTVHRGTSRSEARARAVEMLARVRIAEPESRPTLMKPSFPSSISLPATRTSR